MRQRVVRGSPEAVAAVLAATGGGRTITTASLERLNATVRSSLGPLVRRGRALAHQEQELAAGMSLVGCASNCCWVHESLRLAAPEGATHRWMERIPAMAAGLTAHQWSMAELLRSQVPLAPWVAPMRQGRPPKRPETPVLVGAI